MYFCIFEIFQLLGKNILFGPEMNFFCKKPGVLKLITKSSS